MLFRPVEYSRYNKGLVVFRVDWSTAAGMSHNYLANAIRDALEKQHFQVLRPARGVFQSDVYRLDIDDHSIVVKDFSRRPWWSRLLVCRFLIRREVLVLREFAETGYVPRFYGWVSPDIFAMEFIEGEHPGAHNKAVGSRAFLEIERFLAMFHAAGFAHNDLRRDNVLILGDGSVRFFDFAAALRAPRSRSWLLYPWRKLLAVMQKADQTSLIKMKPDITGNPLNASESRLLKKPVVVRVLQYIWSYGVNKPILRRFK